MGFLSFAGRVLFAAAFLLSAYQEYALLLPPLPLPSLKNSPLANPDLRAPRRGGGRLDLAARRAARLSGGGEGGLDVGSGGWGLLVLSCGARSSGC